MKIREILLKTQFGNPVAEFDEELQSYFLVTEMVRSVTAGKVDIIAGDKGTGKTALYQYLKRSYMNIPELKRHGVEIIAGFNPSGEPLFRRLGEESRMTEGQYVTVWKMYFLSLAGNWLIKRSRGQSTRALRSLEELLRTVDLLSQDDSAGTIFMRLMNWIRLNAAPQEIGVEFTMNEHGIPLWKPVVKLGETRGRETQTTPEIISHDVAFGILNDALKEKKNIAWIMLDRLDEAFVGRPDIEIPALRALIRTYMDLNYSNVKLKLFVRNDLFRKITQEGFVNLDHVTARKKAIVWHEEDLLSMLAHRIRSNAEILRTIGVNAARLTDEQLFRVVFPARIHAGTQSPATWGWMLGQIRDGNRVKAPRNLIDLCIMAQEEQLNVERRRPREYGEGMPLIEADALKKAVNRLSEQRIDDTLMAEYGNDVKTAIKAFRNGKSDHTEETLASLFGVDVVAARLIAKVLKDVGFLEHVGSTYRVPLLYRPGLNITKGPAGNHNSQPAAKKPARKPLSGPKPVAAGG